jgi:hypothetical protein
VHASNKLGPIPAVIPQNVTNKSLLACLKSEKYAFWIILKPMKYIMENKPFKALCFENLTSNLFERKVTVAN